MCDSSVRRCPQKAHRAWECAAFEVLELCLLQQPVLCCSPTLNLLMVLFSTFREAHAINAAPTQQALDPETVLRPQRRALSCTQRSKSPVAWSQAHLGPAQDTRRDGELQFGRSERSCRCTQRHFVHAAAQGRMSSRDFSLSLRLGAGSL